MTDTYRCTSWTRGTSLTTRQRYRPSRRCLNKARFKVVGNKRREADRNTVPIDGEYQCGVWKPWIVTRIDG